MTFAIFYNRQDLTPLAAEVSNPNLAISNQDKNLASKIWNGGLSGWSVAPFSIRAGADPREVAAAGGDTDCRTVVISASNVAVADMAGLLQRIGTQPGAAYMVNIADDIVATAIEPWP